MTIIIQQILLILWLSLIIPPTSSKEEIRETPSTGFTSDSESLADAFYSHFSTFDDAYQLAWRYGNDTIDFRVIVATTGWVGLGFSRTGGMANSDIVIGWVDDSVGYLSDRYALHYGVPLKDDRQDYTLIASSKNSTHTTLSMRRRLNTCDSQDVMITNDTTKLIWAYGTDIPATPDFTNLKQHFHSARGAKSLYLLDPPMIGKNALRDLPPSDIKTIEFLAKSVRITSDLDTLYWCQVFKFPKWSKQYMIGYEPVIQVASRSLVHHMILYGCTRDSMQAFVDLPGEACIDRTKTRMSAMKACGEIYFASWAIGGDGIIFPSDMGLPFFDDASNQTVYALLEIHYNNPLFLSNIVDTSGFRLYFTPKPRPVELGDLTLGVSSDYMSHIIPPRQKEFTTYSYCTSSCTKRLPAGGINILSAFLHTHFTGRKIRVRQYRNGTQLPDAIADENYDNEYQTHRLLRTPVKILPGDDLVVECVYDTSTRTSTVLGGETTREEMCLVSLLYYPRADTIFWCFGTPNRNKQMSFLGGDLQMIATADGTIQNTVVFANQRLPAQQFIEQYNWNQPERPSLVSQFQNVVRNGPQDGFCGWRTTSLEESQKAAAMLQLDATSAAAWIRARIAFDFYSIDGHPRVVEPLERIDDAAFCWNVLNNVTMQPAIAGSNAMPIARGLATESWRVGVAPRLRPSAVFGFLVSCLSSYYVMWVS